MKAVCRIVMVKLILLGALSAPGAIGYINVDFHPGDNLFHIGVSNVDNHLSAMSFPGAPNGTSISLWNPASGVYDVTSTYSEGAWSLDLELTVGTGARLTTPAPFVQTFMGKPLKHDGSLFTGGDNPPPPIFNGPSGVYLLGDKYPAISSNTDVFLNIVGREPNIGEQFTRLDRASQAYVTSTYLGEGGWDVVPTIGYCEAGFFNLIVPEPSVFPLAVLGAFLLRHPLTRKS